MQKSEILTLRWDQLNLEQRFVLLLDTKNGDQRGVPLTESIIGVLREIRSEQEQAGLFSPYVFPNPATGKPYRHDVKTAWYTALRKAGIVDFHFHDLRHTCASYLRMQGVDLRTIAEILENKDLKMIKRYAHIALTHRLAAIEKLESAYRRQEEPTTLSFTAPTDQDQDKE